MNNDDALLGRVLTRREVLALLGAAGLSAWTGCRTEEPTVQSSSRRASLPDCVVRPEQTEGPYFVDAMLNRSDLRLDPADGTVTPGVPLEIAFQVKRLSGNGCAPFPGAMVDVWHCDALGVYSDVRDRSFDTTGKKFLRGYQLTDAHGVARFVTVYPGWYAGRAVHIHFKIRSSPSERRGFDFTSQLYFDEALTDRVHVRPPYASKGPRDQRNEGDGIFDHEGGKNLVLAAAPHGDGYAASFDVALQLG